jgi:DNA invertase Pin-like site-specific DNA recombinase
MEALRHLLAVYADIKRQHIEEGIKIGIEQARERRYRKGLLDGIEALCEVLQIELTEQRREELAGADAERLEQVLAQLRTTRRWPE